MTGKQRFRSLSPSSIQLFTPSIFTANEAMFVYKADRKMEKKKAFVGLGKNEFYIHNRLNKSLHQSTFPTDCNHLNTNSTNDTRKYGTPINGLQTRFKNRPGRGLEPVNLTHFV